MRYLKPYNESAEINSSKKYLASQPYIGIYTTKNNFGKLFIRAIPLINYEKYLLQNEKVTVLSYKTLFRFLLFAFIYKYKGNNETILEYQEILRNNKTYKTNKIYNDSLRLINQMPKNNILISELYSSGLVKTRNTAEENYDILADMHRNMNKIFTEENFMKWYLRIKRITKIANKKEQTVFDLINNNKDIKLKNARKAKDNEDIGGADIIAYTMKGEKKTIQVKMFSSHTEKRVSEKYYDIKLFNTKLDLSNYNKFNDGSLEYDFLFLISKNEIISINSKCINNIVQDLKNKTIEIRLFLKEEWFDRMLKHYKINN